MEGFFIGVLCLSGCLTFSTCLLHQYHFVSDTKTWTEAQSYCREKYTDLATVENPEEIKKLNDTVSTAGYSSEVWIGLHRHPHWKWSDGFNKRGAEYRKWDTDKTNQLCALMMNYGKWFDHNCQARHPSYCYRGELEDSDFVLVNATKTWSELRVTAEKTTQIWSL
ncbi:unnamed protein product [Pleuronectes platessa]|uniref:C-type lectin domain-containing protein n=1 Tax=Pleuronectes platessa TaxID=8262 RepID=A0A9N7V2W6_PLEPL|nr:unnamed protein product [Pleuronectes platessa]